MKRLSESSPDGELKSWILDGLDGRDDGVDDLETLRELGEEGGREGFAELVLKDRRSDGDSPDLTVDEMRASQWESADQTREKIEGESVPEGSNLRREESEETSA